MSANELAKLVKQFNLSKLNGASSEYLNSIADQIQEINMSSYDIHTPFVARRNKITDFELKKWERLAQWTNYDVDKEIKLFDSAFGSGRDLLIAKNLGYDVFGCELSNFLYTNFLAQSKFDPQKIVRADLRYVPFPDNAFDVIRHNASFLHMPLINSGFSVHKCLEESFRLLKKGGSLYIYTKEGQGFTIIDTLDGLGDRSFQLYDEKTLGSLLEDCGFIAKQFNHYKRERNGEYILWIEAFACKK